MVNHDGIIAFGGGSSLDVGKSIAITSSSYDRPLWDCADVKDRFWIENDYVLNLWPKNRITNPDNVKPIHS